MRRMWRCSARTKIIVVMNAAVSATGAAYIIPSMPKNSGRIKSSGTKKNTWRVNDSSAPLSGFPIAEKIPTIYFRLAASV